MLNSTQKCSCGDPNCPSPGDCDAMERTDETADLMEEIASECDGKVYEGYSGRGMYGKRCWGISGPNANEIIVTAAIHGVRKAETDSLGLGVIVYWPHLECK